MNEETRQCDCNSNDNMNNNMNDNMTVMGSSMNNMNDNDNMNCNTRREMMYQIQSLEFAINELALYLDTHPEDERALCLHRKYCKKAKDVKDKYQRVYGPLTINYPCNKWRWLEEPWPWERGNY